MVLTIDPDISILVVDDDKAYCDALNRLLGRKYNVYSAQSIKEAYNLLMEADFGMIIIDFDLRDVIDGIEFSSYLRVISPLSYILMLTGHSDFSLVQRALNEGNINKFLIKPFDTTQLMDIVNESLANFSAKREISLMLQSSDGIKMAQSLLTQVFDESTIGKKLPLDLSGVVISKNSIPLYSKFLNPEVLNNFTDTIFSGFMTAIHMVGKEVFSEDSNVNVIKFGSGVIYFKFYQSYQFCFILQCQQDQINPDSLAEFDSLVETITDRVKQDGNYFNVKNQYIRDIDEDINEILSQIVEKSNI